jgi:hypothetical protein
MCQSWTGQWGARLAVSATVLFGASLASQASARARIPCRPAPGTRTIAHSARARIFEDDHNGNDYACLYRDGHARYLSSTEHYEYRLIRFAGAYVAFVQNIEAVDDHVGVMNLRTGHVRNFQEARPIDNGVCARVESLVLKPDGAVAWIATNFFPPGCDNPPAPTVEVRRHDSRGLQVVDHGIGIAPKSLHRASSLLHWLDGGQVRSSTLL